MSAQLYSVPDQTEKRRTDFLEWKSIDLSCKLSLTCWGNANFIKVLTIPTRENRKHPGNFQNKSISSPFIWDSRHIFISAKLKGRVRSFLKVARRGATLSDYRQEHLVVIRDKKSLSFCEIWFNPTTPLFFIRFPYK